MRGECPVKSGMCYCTGACMRPREGWDERWDDHRIGHLPDGWMPAFPWNQTFDVEVTYADATTETRVQGSPTEDLARSMARSIKRAMPGAVVKVVRVIRIPLPEGATE